MTAGLVVIIWSLAGPALSSVFEQAIDRTAMKVGAKDDDAYMSGFRKAAPFDVEGDAQEVANAEAARIDAAYDADVLKVLIANEGNASE